MTYKSLVSKKYSRLLGKRVFILVGDVKGLVVNDALSYLIHNLQDQALAYRIWDGLSELVSNSEVTFYVTADAAWLTKKFAKYEKSYFCVVNCLGFNFNGQDKDRFVKVSLESIGIRLNPKVLEDLCWMSEEGFFKLRRMLLRCSFRLNPKLFVKLVQDMTGPEIVGMRLLLERGKGSLLKMRGFEDMNRGLFLERLEAMLWKILAVKTFKGDFFILCQQQNIPTGDFFRIQKLSETKRFMDWVRYLLLVIRFNLHGLSESDFVTFVERW